MQEVDLGHHGFGIKQTLAGLSLFLCLWVQTGSGYEMGGGVGLLQGPNTLVPSLESLQGS